MHQATLGGHTLYTHDGHLLDSFHLRFFILDPYLGFEIKKYFSDVNKGVNLLMLFISPENLSKYESQCTRLYQ